MVMTASIPSRRRFLILAALTTAAVPIAFRLFGDDAQAGVLAKLPVDNPQAKALGYVEDVTAKQANYKPGSSCSNCQFFTAATGACSLFAGFQVTPTGWCSAWAQKAG